MDNILEKERETYKKLNEIKALEGETFRSELIRFTEENKLKLIEDLKKANYNHVPLSEHIQFIAKKEDIVSFCEELFMKTEGKINIDPNDAIIIPNNILSIAEGLNKYEHKLSLTKLDIMEILNNYKVAFESVLKLLNPHFKKILNSKTNVDWSLIHESITHSFNNSYKRLFKSMNGLLRNTEGHASSYIEDNRFIWIKENGFRQEYPIKKIYEKTIDLLFLLIALYWGLSEVHIEKIIQAYRICPLDKLKEIYGQLQFPP